MKNCLERGQVPGLENGSQAYVWFFAIEEGARGLVSQSTYTFLREIGLNIKARSKFMENMSRDARGCSLTVDLIKARM